VNALRRVLSVLALVVRFAARHYVRLGAGLVVLACAIFMGVSPFMYRAIWIVCLAPLLVGAVIALISSGRASNWINGLAGFFASGVEKARAGRSETDRYIKKPFFATGSALWKASDVVGQPHLMAALRSTAAIYVAMAVLALFAALVGAWLFAVAFVLAVKVALWIISSDDSKEEREPTTSDAVSYRARGRYYHGSSWLSEELAGRVDNEGNIYRGSSWINEERIGRIASDGTIYRGTSLLNEGVVGRIDSDGTIHRGSNWFTQERSGRILDDGTVMRGRSWLDEEKVGRIEDE